jgi:hypothetical protein
MGKPIIWSGTNAKLINSGDLVDVNGLSLTDGGKITVTQASHGFTSANVGAPLYYSGIAWVLADATTANNSEVVAYIYAVIDTNTLRLIFNGQIATIGSSVLDVGGNLTAGTTYFLSTTPGKITATPTTTVGQINKPVGTAISTTTLELTNYRGQVVGSTNALTQISLANNATTTVQNVASYTGGSLSGYVTIVNSTSANSLTFYVNAPFAKYGAGGNYYISPQYVGDTPPSGFSMTVTAAGLIQITLPNVSGYTSASIVYGLNVPAVGTNFPLSVSASSVLGNAGIAPSSNQLGYLVQKTQTIATALTATSTNFQNFVFSDSTTSISLAPGTWLITAQVYYSGGTGIISCGCGISTDSGSSTFSDQSFGVNRMEVTQSSGVADTSVVVSNYVQSLTSTTSFYMKLQSTFSTVPSYRGRLTAVLVA